MWIPRHWVLVKVVSDPYLQCGSRVYYDTKTDEYITVYTDGGDVRPD